MRSWHHQIVSTGYDQVSEVYRSDDDSADQYVDWCSRILELRPNARTALDIGCGCGIPVCRYFSEHGLQTVGIDISARQIERAKRLAPRAAYICADYLETGDDRHDIITAFYSIIHMDRRLHKRVFEKLYRQLGDQGIAVVTVGHEQWQGDEENWLGVEGARMYWSHYAVERYHAMLNTMNFKTSWGYNSADLMTSMTYPGGSGGQGAYEADALLAASLQKELGPAREVRYPVMPLDEDAGYPDWKAQIAAELAGREGALSLVGHSVGGSILLKFLSEEQVPARIAGLFLIAAPYFGADENWNYEELTLPADFPERLPGTARIFLYHSRDDEVVPFSHLALYAERLPRAVVREFDGRGHQFRNDLAEVASDIKKEDILPKR
jgi:uncharacterized protein